MEANWIKQIVDEALENIIAMIANLQELFNTI